MKSSSSSSLQQRRDRDVYDFDADEEAVEVASERYTNRLHSKLFDRQNCRGGRVGYEAAADGIKDAALTKYDFLRHFTSDGTSKQGTLTGVWDVDLPENNNDHRLCPIEVPDSNLGNDANDELDETMRSSSSRDESGQICIDESENDSLEKETDVISEVDEEGYSSLTGYPSITETDVEENGCSRCPISENFFMTLGNMVDDVVLVSPDHVVYGSTYYGESQLTFTSDYIKMECSNASGSDDKFVAEWSNGDIIHIYCRWSGSFQVALVQLGLRSHIVTGTGEPNNIPNVLQVKFSVRDIHWLEKEHKIKKLSERYRDIWNSHSSSSDDSIWVDDAVDHSVLSSRDNFIETSHPFEDVVYPKGDPDAVSISRRDFELLQPATFINDTIIDFYIKYLENKIQKNEKHRFHFFNSFFFRKLVVLDKARFNGSEGRAAFLRVQKWTRKVNIFEKDYIFIPVNFNLHWSLLVICHPGEITKLKDNNVEEYAKVPCILHMDSIKGSHSGLKNIIQSYIWEEWKERHPESSEVVSIKFLNLRFVPLELPQQENSFDCGLFLLHYVELFLEEVPESFNPFKVTNFSSFLNVDWFQPAEASLKRSFIRKLILKLLNDSSEKAVATCRNNALSTSINPENDVKQKPSVELLPEECSPATLVSNDEFCQVVDTGDEAEFLQTSAFSECDKPTGPIHQEFLEMGNANAPLSSGTEQTNQPYCPKDSKDNTRQLSATLLGMMVVSPDAVGRSARSIGENIVDTVSSHDLLNTNTVLDMRDEDEKIGIMSAENLGYVPDSPCSSSGRKFETCLEDSQEIDASKGDFGDSARCDANEAGDEDDVDCKDIGIIIADSDKDKVVQLDENDVGDGKPVLQDLTITELLDDDEGCQEIACKRSEMEHCGRLEILSVELRSESCDHNDQPPASYPDIVITDDEHSSDDDLQVIATREERQPHKRRRVIQTSHSMIVGAPESMILN